jgi:hypothetical protein
MVVVLFMSCSSDDDNSNDANSLMFSHPAWIIGTWDIQETGDSSEFRTFTFAEDNIILEYTDEPILDFAVDDVTYTFSLSDDANYSFEFTENNSDVSNTIDIIRTAVDEFVLNDGSFDTFIKR